MPHADPTLLGTVQDVQGATVSVALAGTTASGLVFVEGHGYRVGQVGSFVRIPIGYVDLFGVVSQVGAGAVPERLVSAEPYGHRWMTVQLVGEAISGGSFTRGLSQYPTIGDSVHLLAERDLVRLYGFGGASNCLRVGRLANAESIPALVDVDKLVTRHSAVVGATGTGKSTTVTRLLTSITRADRFPSARVLVLDVHGEYANALRDVATVFTASTRPPGAQQPLDIPYWAMTFDELLPLTFGNLEDRERAFVLDQIVDLKASALHRRPVDGVEARSVTVDTPVPFSIKQLWFDLHRLLNATHTAAGTGQSRATEALLEDEQGNVIERGDPERVIPPRYQPRAAQRIFLSGAALNMRRQVDALGTRLRDPRLRFLFDPGPWAAALDGTTEADLDALMAGWLGDERAIVILDLSGVPALILHALIGALLRIVYDALFWGRNLSEGGRERPLLVVLEEAHAYLGRGNSSFASLAVRRIVREGRKYGIGAMIVSQRPSELDPTVLSQCGTLFALRLSNSSDRGHITGTVTDNLEGLLASLPILRTGEAIVLGEAVQLPMRMQVDALSPDRQPDSKDPLVYDDRGPGGWNRRRETDDYRDLGRAWRAQEPRPPRVIDAE